MRLTLPLLLALATPALADQTIDLPGGVPTPVPGTAITLMLTQITDKRCPADRLCRTQGEIRAEIAVLNGTSATTSFILCNACKDATARARLAGMSFTLVQLSPSRAVLDPIGRNPQLSDYTLQVTVTP